MILAAALVEGVALLAAVAGLLAVFTKINRKHVKIILHPTHRAEDAVFYQVTFYIHFYKTIDMDLLTPDLGLFIWNLLAFLIVFFILKKFAWKPILKSLKERETGIADSLATAEKVKAEMAQLKNENEALLAKAREERAQMLKEARETKDKIINEAKEQAKAGGR